MHAGPFIVFAEETHEDSADLLFMPEATASDWATIFSHAEVRTIGAGLALVQAGELDRALYLLTEGTVGVRLPKDEGAFKTIDAPSVLGELVDLPDGPLPDPETPAPVRFLPTWDAALLVHARRTLILPEEHRPRVFNTKMPQSVGTFLVDGAIAGAWRPDGTIEPFQPLSKAQRKAVEAEAARLAAFSA